MTTSTDTTKPVKNATPHDNKGDVFSSFNVEDFDIPRGRDEVWRFISLRELRGLHNGEFAPATPQHFELNTGDDENPVTLEDVDKQDERLGRAGAPVDRVAAQAWTSMDKAQLVTIPADARLDKPVLITITGAGNDLTSFGATSVQVGRHAEATIVLRYEGSGTHADNVEFVIGDGAQVNIIVDANWEYDAVHLSQQNILAGRDAVVRHTVITFGGKVVRIVPRVNYTGSGGDVELNGLYYADSGQYIENRMTVDHSVPNCRSNVFYKGALQASSKARSDLARACWVGDVLIRANAENTDTYETNRNLVLTDNARADSIPNLEIETGEIVGAGHAATVGRFDDEHIFYLQARGIPENVARRMIIRGFFTEVINRIPLESLREELEARVTEELKITAG